MFLFVVWCVLEGIEWNQNTWNSLMEWTLTTAHTVIFSLFSFVQRGWKGENDLIQANHRIHEWNEVME